MTAGRSGTMTGMARDGQIGHHRMTDSIGRCWTVPSFDEESNSLREMIPFRNDSLREMIPFTWIHTERRMAQLVRRARIRRSSRIIAIVRLREETQSSKSCLRCSGRKAETNFKCGNVGGGRKKRKRSETTALIAVCVRSGRGNSSMKSVNLQTTRKMLSPRRGRSRRREREI